MHTETTVYINGNSGRNFAWKSDNAYVRISAEDSGGKYSLIEDNLTTEFHLPRHMHREHTETFYVISGKVEFRMDDRTLVMTTGDTLRIAPGDPHEVICIEPAKMLTMYEPAGLEKLFAAYAEMSPEDMSKPEKYREIDLAYDNIML